MVLQLVEIFFNVIAPVFALVLFGYIAKPRLNLHAATLSRYAYFILIPAFIFQVISRARVDAGLVLQMVSFILVVQAAVGLLAFGVARLLGHGAVMTGAYVLIAVFGNVGNFGLPLIQFRLGDEALVAATIYFLAILTSGFVVGVTAANLPKGRGGLGAVWEVVKTPALLALPPALLANVVQWEAPLFVVRVVDLLAAAMVPTMLVTLGVQLADVKEIKITRDVVLASVVRLVGGPALALLLVTPFGLGGLERGAGIFQAAMPAAVITSIIALENDLAPDFVTTTVLFSTLASVVTLTVLLAVV